MKPDRFQFSPLVGGVALWLLAGGASAQIVPDNSLPNNSVVPPNCTTCEITGGTRSNNNLFHSFETFSVPTGGSAFFNNAIDIRNIFARVTGRSASSIDGLLRANGTANLFLLNPNGILFGPNASLNIGGSLIATTADRIQFSDGLEFSASNPTSSLLSVNVPIGLQLGSNAGAITNRSQASPGGAVNTLGQPVGLQGAPGQTLALVGDGVSLENGNLTARGGTVQIGSVAPSSSVALVASGTGYSLDFSSVSGFSSIRSTNLSYIDTSGEIGGIEAGGAIQLQGSTIALQNSTLSSSTYTGQGGTLELNATQSLTFSQSFAGTFSEGTGRAGNIALEVDGILELTGAFPSFLGSQTFAAGDAGDTRITADQLSVRNGSRIEASTFSTGQGGNIVVEADRVEVIGFNPQAFDVDGDGTVEPVGFVTSGIVSQVGRGAGQDSGNAGNLTLRTQDLAVLDGGVISTATLAGGDGGTLTVDATNSILIQGASPQVRRNQYRSGIFVSAEPRATGSVGALTITTPQLTVTDLGEISANNRGSGQAGTATLNVDNLVIRDGGEIRASSLGSGPGGRLVVNADTVLLTGTGVIGSETVPSALAALARSSGDAGDLEITASSLRVRDGAEVTVSGREAGAAGNLTVSAQTIALDRGQLTASTNAGGGAEITLQNVELLVLGDRSRITAQANNNANGGNVTINAANGFVVAVPDQDNDIVANAVAGRGGNITITTQGILGLQEQRALENNGTNDLDASSEFGVSGSVTLNTPDVDPSQGLVELPSNLVDASRLIAQNCAAGGNVASNPSSEFVITGRGGLPPNPGDLFSSNAVQTGWVTLPSESAQTLPTPAEPIYPIVEAQGWMRGNNGEVMLVAQAPGVQPQGAALTISDCDALREEP